MRPIIEVENLSKLYRLGAIGSTTLRDSLERWWYRMHGKEELCWEIGTKHFMIEPHDPQAGPEPNTIWALKDISFSVQHGEIIGIIGKNGAGKSTLLKILTRITEPTSGRAIIRGRVSSLLEVGIGFHPELTGRENVYLNGTILGMRKEEIDRKFDEIVAFAEIEKFIDTPIKRYSSGMYVRLAFAVAAHLEPEILLVDEVLAVGDIAFQKKCLSKMGTLAEGGRTVLFVSHSMAAVTHLCERGMLLENGRLTLSGTAREVADFYLQAAAEGLQRRTYATNSIYEASDAELGQDDDFCIFKIEVLDISGNPAPMVSTGDDVVLRFHYRSNRHVSRASVEWELRSMNGAKLIHLWTQPGVGFPVKLELGLHCADCIIKKLPLAAGEYVVGAGISVQQLEWLWRRPELGRLTVYPRDVYNTGIAIDTSLSLLAVEHRWRHIS
jgi:lipopolysaccharide transport system ATP-binding protein